MHLIVQATLFKKKIFSRKSTRKFIFQKMNQIIFLSYLTLSVFISSTWTVTASSEKVDNIQLIYDFLLTHKSGEFVEYAELIKKENNTNAKKSPYNKESALHKGMC
jgi:hypothetical protein